MTFVAAGADDGAGSEAPVLGASSSSVSAPAVVRHEGVSAMAGGDQLAGLGDEVQQKQACFAPADVDRYTPYRLTPIAACCREAERNTPRSAPSPRGHQLRPAQLPQATQLPLLEVGSSPARSTASRRKRQTQPKLKACRSISCMARGSSAWSWFRDVTGQPKLPRSVETFRIRDASCHAARACVPRTAISRLGHSCGESCHQLRPQKIPTGAGGFTSSFSLFLALTVVSCMLFYIVAQKSEYGPSAEKQYK